MLVHHQRVTNYTTPTSSTTHNPIPGYSPTLLNPRRADVSAADYHGDVREIARAVEEVMTMFGVFLFIWMLCLVYYTRQELKKMDS